MWKTYGNPVWYIHYSFSTLWVQKGWKSQLYTGVPWKVCNACLGAVTKCLYSAHFQAFCISFEGWAKICYLYGMVGRMKNCCLILLILKPEVHQNNIKNSVPTAQETNCVLIAQTEQLIMFMEMINFFGSQEKQVHVPLGKWRFFILKPSEILCFEWLMCTLWKIYSWT